MPVAFFALAVVTAPPIAPVPPEMSFDGWTVACDNHRDCGGVALGDGDEDGQVWALTFTRRGAAGASARIEGVPAEGADSPGAVSLLIDGKRGFGFDQGGSLTGGDGLRFLRALSAARKVEVVDAKGSRVGSIPVKGASAAMRYVDDRQRRAGTVTAIVAGGARPAQAVPPQPALPRIATPAAAKAKPRTLTRAQIAKVKAIGQDMCTDDLPDNKPSYYRLDAAHSLAIVPCMLGAYQGASVIAVVDDKGKWQPARIERAEKLDGPPDSFWTYTVTEAEYDPKTRTLDSYAKGRGLGDCGTLASWVWDGKMFRLSSYQALTVCLGAPPGTVLPRWQTANDPLADQ
jgi:hypothetical protein